MLIFILTICLNINIHNHNKIYDCPTIRSIEYSQVLAYLPPFKAKLLNSLFNTDILIQSIFYYISPKYICLYFFSESPYLYGNYL